MLLTLLLAICLRPALSVRDIMVENRYYVTPYQNAKFLTLDRLIMIMQTLYTKIDERITALNPIKFRFEKSKEFEEGYLVGEIIEKYRQMVEHVKMTEKIKSYANYDCLLRMEMVHSGYLEIYRLVNMMHEVPRKYGVDIKRFRPVIRKGDPKELLRAIKSLQLKAIKRQKERKNRMKELKRLRDMMQEGTSTLTPRTTKKRQQYWQYADYGWELDADYMVTEKINV